VPAALAAHPGMLAGTRVSHAGDRIEDLFSRAMRLLIEPRKPAWERPLA
jgi:hypothetical protein